MLLAAIADRMAEVGLRLHPDKSRIVYCKDSNRRLSYGNTAFTSLGFTFRPRVAHGRNTTRFASFLSAINKEALNKISEQLRQWRLHRLIGLTFTQSCGARYSTTGHCSTGQHCTPSYTASTPT